MNNYTMFLLSNNFIAVNRELIKAVGVEEAVIMGELIDELTYCTENNSLTEDGYFRCTVEDLEKVICLSDHKQRRALKHLQELGIVDVKSKGIPQKRYIKIFEQALLAQFK